MYEMHDFVWLSREIFHAIGSAITCDQLLPDGELSQVFVVQAIGACSPTDVVSAALL